MKYSSPSPIRPMELRVILLFFSLLALQIDSRRPVVDLTQQQYTCDHSALLKIQHRTRVKDKHPSNKTITCHGGCYFYIQKNELIGGYLFSSGCELHKPGRFSEGNCTTTKGQQMIRCACHHDMCNHPSKVDIPSHMETFANLMQQREAAKGAQQT